MLNTDEIIVNILLTAKEDGNELLQYFKIGHPSNRIAEESNSIFVASVDSEAREIGYGFQTFLDKVEILIVTKNQEYLKAIEIIKTVSREVMRLINSNKELFANKPVFERVTPEYNSNYALTRGHIMVQVKTEPLDFDAEEDYRRVCQILTDEMDVNIE